MNKEPNDVLFDLLTEYEIPITSQGFYYIAWMVEKASNQDCYMLHYADYDKCAKAFDSTPSRVERAIRYAFLHSNIQNSKNLTTIYMLTREYVKRKKR